MTEDLRNVMCRKSVRLQEAWKPKEGDNTDYDFIVYLRKYHHRRRRYVIKTYFMPADKSDFEKKELTWLPRQEDLQELLFENKSEVFENNYEAISRFYKFINTDYKQKYFGHTVTPVCICEHMVQLWLLFVHKELWNQTWSFENKKWVGVKK